MPGRNIPLVTGEFYHIYNRGVNKKPIFLNVRDYKRALELITFYQFENPPIRYSKFIQFPRDKRAEVWKELMKYPNIVNINTFCFMPNHFHFLLEQTADKGISKFVANFQNSYTRYFNTKQMGIGPLLQGQFKAVRIEDEEQLLHVHRYIHLNPYTSFVVKNLEQLMHYPWSSIEEYVDTENQGICKKEIIFSNFKDEKSYRDFIVDQADYQRDLDRIKHLTIETS